MNIYLSINEVANLLGVSLRSVQKACKEGKYQTEQVPAKGGKGGFKYEIALASLPQHAQDAYKKQQADAVLAALPVPVQQDLPGVSLPAKLEEDLGQYSAKQRDANLAIKTLMNWIEAYPGAMTKAVKALNDGYQDGSLPSALVSAIERSRFKKSGVKRTEQVLSLKTVEKWVAKHKKTGSYIPKARTKDYSVKEWHGMAITLYLRPQKPTLASVVAELVNHYPTVSYTMVYDFFSEKFSQVEIIKGQNAGQQRRALMYYKRRTADGLEPWQEIHADGWATHFTAPHPITGEYVTYEVWDFHDVATRFVPPLSIGLTENTEVIAKGIENAIRFGGVMTILMTDSTKIVKNNAKFTGNPVLSIADRAGITITHPVIVGSGQTNGIAENFHSWLDKECRVLATYQAKNMDSLTLRRTQKLTAKLVKAKADGDGQAIADASAELAKTSRGIVFQTYDEAIDWLEGIRQKWNAKPHSSLKKIKDPVLGRMRHQSPQEALDEWTANGWAPVAMDEQEIIDLFRPRVQLKVRRGTVKPYGGKDGPRFRHADLDHWEGKDVVVAYDIMDYRQVWVYTHKGEHICTAGFDELCSYRAQTAYDSATEKRALAQVRRLERKADLVKNRAGLDNIDAIDSTASQVFEFEVIEDTQKAQPIEAIDWYQEEPEVKQGGDYQNTMLWLWGVNDDDEDEVKNEQQQQ